MQSFLKIKQFPAPRRVGPGRRLRAENWAGLGWHGTEPTCSARAAHTLFPLARAVGSPTLNV